MTTLPLVAPEARDRVTQFPAPVITADTLDDFRALILSLYPDEQVGQEEIERSSRSRVRRAGSTRCRIKGRRWATGVGLVVPYVA